MPPPSDASEALVGGEQGGQASSQGLWLVLSGPRPGDDDALEGGFQFSSVVSEEFTNGPFGSIADDGIADLFADGHAQSGFDLAGWAADEEKKVGRDRFFALLGYPSVVGRSQKAGRTWEGVAAFFVCPPFPFWLSFPLWERERGVDGVTHRGRRDTAPFRRGTAVRGYRGVAAIIL